MRSSILFCWAVIIASACFVSRSLRADDFALKDGDTVVFLGDSITAERTYGKLIEQYTLLRYPERKVRFINAGKGGETAHGVLPRLDSDVFSHNPTVLTVAYGINDIGWGGKADEEHKQKYLTGIKTIVERAVEKGIRVYICSAAITSSNPQNSENDFLQKMCDEGMQLSQSLGGNAIDVQRGMRQIQKEVWKSLADKPEQERKEVLHAADGIHLSKSGSVAMGYAILKGLGAPEEVSSAVIDAASNTLVEQTGCDVSQLKSEADRVEFVRLDSALPLNADTFFIFTNRYIPITTGLNGYRLQVTSLPAGKYSVKADGRTVSIYDAEQLAAGVNIASATTDFWLPGGPWDAQANILNHLTEARDEVQVSGARSSQHFPGQPFSTELLQHIETVNAEIEKLQREVAKPRPYHFVIEPATEEPMAN